MTNIIKIKEVANKLSYDYKMPIVCGNSNYELQFEFSEVWKQIDKKTAIFFVNGKKIFVEFTGDSCKMPSMPNSYFCSLYISAVLGDENYNTSELMLSLTKNELDEEVQVMDPFVGYYSRLLCAIKKCEAGDIPVKSCEIAITANSSETATYAESSKNAEHSTTSEISTYAESSKNAEHSTTSEISTFAESSRNADHSETSETATYAETSKNSTYSETSGFATNSENSAYSTYAETSGSSAHSDSSDYSTLSNKSETQVSLTGDETISGEKNFIDNLKKKGEDVLNIKEISNKNILINEEFLINQRGETSYSGENVYSVDRWKLGSEFSVATKEDDAKWRFEISGSSDNESKILVMQYVENYGSFIGQKVTASLKFKELVESASGTTALMISDGISSSFEILSSNNEIAKVTHEVSESATMLSVIIISIVGKNCSIKPIYCKLEHGEFATAFVPRNPSEEIWLCQRYYQNIKLDGQGGGTSAATVVQPLIILNNNLRVKPTATMVTYPYVWNTNGTNYKSKSFIFRHLHYNCYEISLTVDSTDKPSLTSFTPNILRNGSMTLDAEIY